MVAATVDEIIDRLGSAGELAMLASVAARVDRAIIRTLRLELTDSDATVESELWFSPIVARRSVNEVVFDDVALAALRKRLAGSDRLAAARAVLEQVHAGASPLLALEEELIFLALDGKQPARIEQLLGNVFATLDDPSRTADVAAWALRALPRLPPLARDTAPAWSLGFAAAAKVGFAVPLGERAPEGELVAISTPAVAIGVLRTITAVQFGKFSNPQISVAGTSPRIVALENAGSRKYVAIPVGGTVEVPVSDGDVVLTNLSGQRWRVRRQSVAAPEAPLKPENGYWILVDGNDQFELPLHHDALARALGRALARAGFSLITLGTQGVSHVVARAFWEAIEPDGYTSGIYRITHLLEAGATPDVTERGRSVVAVGDRVIEATIYSDAVISIGASLYSDRLSGHAETFAREHVRLDDTGVGPLVPVRPKVWTQPVAREFVADVLHRITGSLGIGTEVPGVYADLFALAAIALDRSDLTMYKWDLQLIRKRSSGISGLAELVTDRRCMSHRLVGYVASERIPPAYLGKGLTADLVMAMRLGDTRTLLLALEAVVRLEDSSDDREDRAVAALCVTIATSLQRRGDIDASGECKTLVGRVLSRGEANARAVQLGDIAERCERLLEADPDSERTDELDDLAEEIRGRVVFPTTDEATSWSAVGTRGRTIALGLFLGSPEVEGFELVTQILRTTKYLFERYLALRVLQRMIDQLADDARARLREDLDAVLVDPRVSRRSPIRSTAEELVARLNGRSPALPSLWIFTVSGALGDTHTFAGSTELARDDKVLVFVRDPALRPYAIYEVTSTHVLATTESTGNRATGRSARARRRLSLPAPSHQILDVHRDEIVAISNSTSQRDADSLRLRHRIAELLAALYADSSSVLRSIRALLVAREDSVTTQSSASLVSFLFGRDEIERWLRSNNHLGDQAVIGAVNVFSTEAQRTWLVFVEHEVICLLDDADTRDGNALVQFRAPPKDIEPVRVEPDPPTGDGIRTGTLSLGAHGDWVCSPSLFGGPVQLRRKIEELIARASVPSNN